MALGLILAVPQDADARDRDKDKKKKQTEAAAESVAAARRGGGPEPGNCTAGRAERDLNVNNVSARAFVNGSLFFGNSSQAEYYVEGASSIFASGIWIGGRAEGSIVTAGATYADFEFWPGPLAEGGRPVNPNDCSAYDRIWSVTRDDINAYEANGTLTRDLEEWPFELGAPVIDGDGNPNNYDLAAGDRPDIILDQSLWWVMNDVGNAHANTGSAPLGIEVRVQAFSVNESGVLGNTTFYKYTVINKSSRPITSTYLSIFSDPDLGDAGDDFVGSDIDQSLGYVYNSTNFDTGGDFGAYGFGVPAVGYDFFQGPIVDLDVDGVGDDLAPDTLGLSGFNYFINSGPPDLSDPSGLEEYYNVMQGLTPPGNELTEGGLGLGGGTPTKFAFNGNPFTGEGWSEVSAGNPAGDRRFVLSTGPFVLEQNTPQEIVFGVVWSRVVDTRDSRDQPNLRSVAQLIVDDLTAQQVYDNDFEVRRAPPAPPLCMRNDPNPELRPGSGSCLEAIEDDGRVTLVWGYPEGSTNANAAFDSSGVAFEGFNVYVYPNSDFADTDKRLVATFDKINDQEIVSNTVLDTDLLDFVQEAAAFGTNSGLQYYYNVDQDLNNYTDYYFGVSAYGLSPNDELQRVYESTINTITVRPTKRTGIEFGGSVAPLSIGDELTFTNSGLGFQNVIAEVVDPRSVVGGVYEVTAEPLQIPDSDSTTTTVFTYTIRRDGEVIFDGPAKYFETRRVPEFGDRIVIDGLAFFQTTSSLPSFDEQDFDSVTAGPDLQTFDIAGTGYFEGEQILGYEVDDRIEGAGVVETSASAGDACSVIDLGCIYYDGNTVFNDLNSTGDYFLSAIEQGALSAAVSRLYVSASIEGDGSNAGAGLLRGDDIEIRFTDACATGDCYGIYWGRINGQGASGPSFVAKVPFEVWNTRRNENDGVTGDASDDVRMIPVLRSDGVNEDGEIIIPDNWRESLITTVNGDVVNDVTGDVSIASQIFAYMPDRDGGYDLFAQAAAASGGAGSAYVETEPEDDTCRVNAFYADFCYVTEQYISPFGNALIARAVFGVPEGGALPGVGTVVQVNSIAKRPQLSADNVFTLNTTDFVLQTGQTEVAEDALDGIYVTPNPYRGRSTYERSTNDRRVRFIGLPEQATIRIYTVAGSLIRTIDKAGPGTSIDWNLETQNNLPVASGMYFVHIEARTGSGERIGEKVLKLGVIQRNTRVNIF